MDMDPQKPMDEQDPPAQHDDDPPAPPTTDEEASKSPDGAETAGTGETAVLGDPSGSGPASSGPADKQEPPEEQEAHPDKPFLAGTWKGHERYQCPECSYSVVHPNGPSIIYAHLGQVHHIVEVSKVLAPNGKPIAKVRKR